jgi:hypothetical protein
LICAQACADDSGDAELLKKLSALWRGQRTAVQSAVVEYREVARDAQPKRESADVVALIGKGDWVADEKALRSLIPKLDASLAGAPELWGACKLTFDGTDARADRTGPQFRSSLVRGEAYDIFSCTTGPAGGNQIDVYDSGCSHMHLASMRDSNRVPSEKFCQDATIDHAEKSVPAGRLNLKAGPEEAIVDPDTGFVFEYHFGTVNDRFYQEAYQFAPTKHGDIVLPTGIFSGRYRDGQMKSFTIFIIDNVTLNQPVAPSEFSVSGQRGDTLVDHSRGGHVVVELSRNVADILDL